ncbi:site-2 protease family protein [Brachybacterium sp. ACRRE]|uniref:site-2 protease family protein n=1 Tax=Brachybacterium sp. ACRRE TaxID=2918184 RepID=UPI001EF1EB26|nr:site-2 protease family protein [Brachybacterium sp. ACRRE]MCG7309117.1 site-2 protease family protein [Brachybacterium sp. ACRRE]
MPAPSLRLPGLPPIRISGATLVMVAVITLLVAPGFRIIPGMTSAGVLVLSLAVGVSLVVSVALHEIGHAIVARASGAHVDHIALTLWGGHTTYRARRVGALPSVLISLAGPAVNLVIAVAAALAERAAPGAGSSHLLTMISSLNWALAVFNVLPGLPMDGGRALESLLGALLRSPRTATRITAWIGRVIAIVVVAGPLLAALRFPGSTSVILVLWGVMIGMMLWRGAGDALREAGLRERVLALRAGDLMVRIPLVRADAPLTTLPSGTEDAPGSQCTPGAADTAGPDGRGVPRLLVLDPSHGVGVLDEEALASVPGTQRPAVPVGAVTTWLGAPGRLAEDLAGEDLVEAVQTQRRAVHLVTGEGGEIVGVVTTAMIDRALQQG